MMVQLTSLLVTFSADGMIGSWTAYTCCSKVAILGKVNRSIDQSKQCHYAASEL